MRLACAGVARGLQPRMQLAASRLGLTPRRGAVEEPGMHRGGGFRAPDRRAAINRRCFQINRPADRAL